MGRRQRSAAKGRNLYARRPKVNNLPRPRRRHAPSLRIVGPRTDVVGRLQRPLRDLPCSMSANRKRTWSVMRPLHTVVRAISRALLDASHRLRNDCPVGRTAGHRLALSACFSRRRHQGDGERQTSEGRGSAKRQKQGQGLHHKPPLPLPENPCVGKKPPLRLECEGADRLNNEPRRRPERPGPDTTRTRS